MSHGSWCERKKRDKKLYLHEPHLKEIKRDIVFFMAYYKFKQPFGVDVEYFHSVNQPEYVISLVHKTTGSYRMCDTYDFIRPHAQSIRDLETILAEAVRRFPPSVKGFV